MLINKRRGIIDLVVNHNIKIFLGVVGCDLFERKFFRHVEFSRQLTLKRL